MNYRIRNLFISASSCDRIRKESQQQVAKSLTTVSVIYCDTMRSYGNLVMVYPKFKRGPDPSYFQTWFWCILSFNIPLVHPILEPGCGA